MNDDHELTERNDLEARIRTLTEVADDCLAFLKACDWNDSNSEAEAGNLMEALRKALSQE